MCQKYDSSFELIMQTCDPTVQLQYYANARTYMYTESGQKLCKSYTLRVSQRMAPAQCSLGNVEQRTYQSPLCCMKYCHQTKRNYVKLFALTDEQWPSWSLLKSHELYILHPSQALSCKNKLQWKYFGSLSRS